MLELCIPMYSKMTTNVWSIVEFYMEAAKSLCTKLLLVHVLAHIHDSHVIISFYGNSCHVACSLHNEYRNHSKLDVLFPSIHHCTQPDITGGHLIMN